MPKTPTPAPSEPETESKTTTSIPPVALIQHARWTPIGSTPAVVHIDGTPFRSDRPKSQPQEAEINHAVNTIIAALKPA